MCASEHAYPKPWSVRSLDVDGERLTQELVHLFGTSRVPGVDIHLCSYLSMDKVFY